MDRQAPGAASDFGAEGDADEPFVPGRVSMRNERLQDGVQIYRTGQRATAGRKPPPVPTPLNGRRPLISGPSTSVLADLVMLQIAKFLRK